MNEKVQELLADWEMARQDGNGTSAEELCRDCPDLLPKLKSAISSLMQTSWLFEPQEINRTASPSPRPKSGNEFLDAVRQYQLVGESELKQLDENADAEALARKLEDAGHLSAYQAQVMLGYRDGPIRLDRYLVEDEIGEGGMGKVYRAVHTSMKRKVALKMLSSANISDQRKSRFRREIQTIASISHPNVVTAYDACEVDGEFFLAMELIDGDNLSEVIQQSGPMDYESAADVVRQIALATASAHEKGIIHRDIKPSNVQLTAAGPSKLLDLGIARMNEVGGSKPATGSTKQNSTEITGDNTPVGTIAYMSPEQAMNAKKADARSDIYSLGCTFFYLLTGKPPFERDNVVEMIVAHREEPVDARVEKLNIPTHGHEILCRMMAKDPRQRFDSMEEVAQSIAGESPAPIAVIAKPTAKTGAKPAWLLVASMLLALAAGGVVFFGPKSKPPLTEQQSSLTSRTWQNDLARWVLNHQGAVVAQTEFGEQTIDTIEAIPNSPISLKELTLIDTPSTFSIEWLTKLPELRSLTLDYCFLTDADSKALTQLESLRSLSLGSCDVPTSVWQALHSISSLRTLSLTDIEHEENDLHHLQKIANLESLTINDMDFTDEDFQFISPLENLSLLDLEGTNVQSSPLSWVAKQSKLNHFDLSRTLVTDADLKDVAVNDQLALVAFENCAVGSEAVFWIARLPNVSDVYLGGSGITDEDLVVLSENQSITSLDIRDTKITVDGLRTLSSLKQLDMLALSGLNIGDEDLKVLLNLNLSTLDLSDTQITDAGLLTLQDMDLSELVVADCPSITEDGIEQFGNNNPSCIVITESFVVTVQE